MMVKELMAIFGVEKVGGGSYPLESRTPQEKKIIEK